MQLYNGTGCLIFLVGSLTVMPDITKKCTRAIITVTRKRHCCSKNIADKTECYRVVLNPTDTFRIMKFGFPGMTISIRGDFSTDNKAEIIAEKIDFIELENANQFDIATYAGTLTKKEMNTLDLSGTEMAYWFTPDGAMRNELMYIH